MAEEIDRIFRSPYSLGRGDAGISTSDGHEAIFYNPAGIANGKGIYKEAVFASPAIILSTDTKDLAKKIAIEKKNSPETLRQHLGRNQHLAVSNFTGIVLRRAAIGALVSSQSNILVYKSKYQGGLEEVKGSTATNQVLTFSVAEKFFNDALLVGATAKYITRAVGKIQVSILDAQNFGETLNQDDIIGTGRGGGGNLGLIYQTKGRNSLSLGFTIENVGDTQIIPDKPSEAIQNLKQTINAGIGYTLGTRLSSFKFNLDIRDLQKKNETNMKKNFHGGFEISFRDITGFTTGINQGYGTFGIFVDLGIMRGDFGVYTQETGERIGSRPDERFFFRFLIGL